MTTSTSTRISAEDRAEIIELHARCMWGLDCADGEMFLSAFAEDGELDHLWNGTIKGHAAILKAMEELWYGHQAWCFGRQHPCNHFIMEPHPEGIKVRCFFQITQFSAEYGTYFLFNIGTRESLCVRRNGRWLFKSMRVNAWLRQEDVPWKGKITMAGRPGA